MDAVHSNALMRSVAAIGACIAVLAACLVAMLGSASPAHAAELSKFCGGWLAGEGWCVGAERKFYALEGGGEQHIICLGWLAEGVIHEKGTCSGGPGQYVYWATGTIKAGPEIVNRGKGENKVQGYAYS
jgi:hypothetical protein